MSFVLSIESNGIVHKSEPFMQASVCVDALAQEMDLYERRGKGRVTMNMRDERGRLIISKEVVRLRSDLENPK